MVLSAILGAALPVIGGLLGAGGGGNDSSTSKTQQNSPWSGVADYLTGSPGSWGYNNEYTPGAGGLYPAAAEQFAGGAWSPEMGGTAEQLMQYLQGAAPELMDQTSGLAGGLASGQYDPNYAPVQPTGGLGAINENGIQQAPVVTPEGVPTPGNISINPTETLSARMQGGQVNAPTVANQAVSAQNIDPTQAFQSLGAANPTGSLNRLLTGQADNPQLAAMAGAYTNQAEQSYDDMLRNLETTLMPQSRNAAVGAGQYGGSRQGIAEGLMGEAGARYARDLSQSAQDSMANLYGNAYESAQNRMGTTANSLSGQGLGNAQVNAGNQLMASRDTAGNALTAGLNNANLGFNAQTVNNDRMYGAGMFDIGNDIEMQGQNVANQMGAGAWNAGAVNDAYMFNAGNNLDAQRFNSSLSYGAQEQNIENAMRQQQFNAGLGFQNNTQQAQNTAQQLQNRMAGIGLNAGNIDTYTQMMNQTLGLQQMPNEYNWQNLMNYSGILSPGLGVPGNTTTSGSSSPSWTESFGTWAGATDDLISSIPWFGSGGNPMDSDQ